MVKAKVYALKNIVNGFAYIGVTQCKLSKRLREHRCRCNKRKHNAVKLQEDWHKYGESVFVISILCEIDNYIPHSHCNEEQKWIDHYNSIGKLYNGHARSTGLGGEITKKGNLASRKAVGNRWSPETNEKRRIAQLGKPKGHGAKISATKRAKRLLMI